MPRGLSLYLCRFVARLCQIRHVYVPCAVLRYLKVEQRKIFKMPTCGYVKVLPVQQHRGNTRVYYVNNGDKSAMVYKKVFLVFIECQVVKLHGLWQVRHSKVEFPNYMDVDVIPPLIRHRKMT